MSDDLVKQLRSGPIDFNQVFLAGVPHDARCLEAADRIAAQDAELARLREQLAEAERDRDEFRQQRDEARQIIIEGTPLGGRNMATKALNLITVKLREAERQRDAARAGALEEAAKAATSFLVGDPENDVPLRNPMAHEIAAAIRALITAPAPTISPAEAAKVLLDAWDGLGKAWMAARSKTREMIDRMDATPYHEKGEAILDIAGGEIPKAFLRAIAEEKP